MKKQVKKTGIKKYLPTILIVGAALAVIVFVVFAMTRPDTSKQAQGPATTEDLAQLKVGASQGNPASKVVVTEFGDYQCSACASWYPYLHDTFLPAYSDKILFVFKNYPLPMHKNAQTSAQAAEAAGLQNKFWQMHDKLYLAQKEWENDEDPTSRFEGYARDLGLDIDKYKNDFNSNVVKDLIKKDVALGDKLGLPGTPSFLVNGTIINPQSFKDLQSAVDQALAQTP